MKSLNARLTAVEKQVEVTDGCRLFFIEDSGVHCSLDYIPDLPAGYTEEEFATYKKMYYRGDVITFDGRGMLD